MFAGYFIFGATAKILVQTKNASGVPAPSAALPTYRVYGQSGVVASGTCVKKDTGSITGATNAIPIVITSANHGLTTGTRVTIANVAGNTAANGNWTITRIDANSFSLDASSGNGDYVSGGDWEVTGLYEVSIVLSGANGFVADSHYDVVVDYLMSGISQRQNFRIGAT